jgi:hypothetical protein
MALIRENNLEKIVLKFNEQGANDILCKVGFMPLYLINVTHI